MTQEHIIAKWVPGVMHGEGVLRHAYREHGAKDDTRSWQALEASFTAGVVCRRCNNGWMSDLEIAAQRYLPPFIRGRKGMRINYKNAPVMARWAAKTVLMFQASEPVENRVVPPEHFQRLRGLPADPLPEVARVWVGSVRSYGAWARAFAGTLDFAPDRPAFYTGLLAIDRVAFMVIGSDDPDALARLELGHLGNGWRPLWPFLRPHGWPPPYVWPPEQFPGMPEIMAALVTTT